MRSNAVRGCLAVAAALVGLTLLSGGSAGGASGDGLACSPAIGVEIRSAAQADLLDAGRLRVRLRFCPGAARTKLRARVRADGETDKIARVRTVDVGPRIRSFRLTLSRRGERLLARCGEQVLIVSASGLFESDILVAGEDREPVQPDPGICPG